MGGIFFQGIHERAEFAVALDGELLDVGQKRLLLGVDPLHLAEGGEQGEVGGDTPHAVVKVANEVLALAVGALGQQVALEFGGLVARPQGGRVGLPRFQTLALVDERQRAKGPDKRPKNRHGKRDDVGHHRIHDRHRRGEKRNRAKPVEEGQATKPRRRAEEQGRKPQARFGGEEKLPRPQAVKKEKNRLREKGPHGLVGIHQDKPVKAQQQRQRDKQRQLEHRTPPEKSRRAQIKKQSTGHRQGGGKQLRENIRFDVERQGMEERRVRDQADGSTGSHDIEGQGQAVQNRTDKPQTNAGHLAVESPDNREGQSLEQVDQPGNKGKRGNVEHDRWRGSGFGQDRVDARD